MPQKHPPASTAVSSPAPCAGDSAAGGWIIIAADSACAANGTAATASERRAVRSIMAVIPVRLVAFIYERSRRGALHDVTRWREGDVLSRYQSAHPRESGGPEQTGSPLS